MISTERGLCLDFDFDTCNIYPANLVWTTTSNLNQGRQTLAGCGTVSDALSFGGGTTTAVVATTEKWNGSSWATTTNLTIARYALAGCGTTSGALSFGGGTTAAVATVEKWNGSSWTITSSLNVARLGLAGCGTTSGALSFGGGTTAAVATVEKWNGNTWTITTDMNNKLSNSGLCGDILNALIIGGYNYYVVNKVQRWDGNIWINSSNTIYPTGDQSCYGNILSALSCGGYTGAPATRIEKCISTSYIYTNNIIGLLTNFSSSIINYPGKVGNSFYFDGNSYVNFENSTYLENSQMSVEVWIKPTSLGSGLHPNIIQYKSATYQFVLGLTGTDVTPDNPNTFWVSFDEINNYRCQAPENILSIDNWFHIVATYSSGSWILYLNGVQQSIFDVSVPIYRNNQGTIGARLNADIIEEPFTGYIDNLKIYNVVLTDSEVLQNYNSQSKVYIV